MENITQMISSVGFPIAMSLMLFWYLREESQNHKQETNGLREAINNLELAITKLIDRIEGKNEN